MSAGLLSDAVFPGLEAALDPERMQAQFQRALPEGHDELIVEDVRIFNVQYRPQVRCTVLYQIKVRRGPDGRSSTQQVAGRLDHPDDPAPDVEPDAREAYRALKGLPLGEPSLRLPELGMTAWAYPFDPALPGLLAASDPRHVREALGRMWRRRPVRVRRVTIDPLGYTPGARAALHYEVLSEERDTGLPEVRHLVAKTDAQREAPELFARSWAVWRASAGRIRLAAPVGYLPDLGLWLQERVDGQRLADVVGTGNVFRPLRQTAAYLGTLHELDLPLRSRRAAAHHVKSVRRWSGMLTAVRPGDARRIRDLRRRIVALLEDRARITGPVHGDLHPANVLVAGERVTLVDLDNMSLGDRLLDVGRFLSALRVSSLRAFGDADALADARESFLDRYLSQSGEDPRRARLFEAASLMISAGTGFRLQRDGWARAAGTLVDEVERVLGEAEAGPSVAVAAPAPRAVAGRPAARSGVDWPTDGLYMAALLAAPVRDAFGGEVLHCACERKAPAMRRERIRYALQLQRGDGRVKLTLDGIRWLDGRAGRASRRLAAVSRALESAPGSPVLPRQVAYLRDVGMQVLELPSGIPFEAVLAGAGGEAAVNALAEALVALQAAPAELERKRPLKNECAAVRKRAGGVREARLRGAVLELLARLTPRWLDAEAPPVIVLRHLSPRRLVLGAGGRVGLREVDDLALAHPLLDPADFLGRLALSRMQGAPLPASLEATFRERYVGQARASRADLAVFESAALLRHACVTAEAFPDGSLARGLLGLAERRLEDAAVGGVR